jgi:hypothetical protein
LVVGRTAAEAGVWAGMGAGASAAAVTAGGADCACMLRGAARPAASISKQTVWFADFISASGTGGMGDAWR